MAKPYDPTKVTEKQIRRAQAATTDYTAGVQAVTESPTAKAAKKIDKMRAGFNAAIDSGKVADGLNAVTLDDWKNATTKKGGERYASGVSDSQDKVQAFHEELSSFMGPHLQKINSMPDTTPDQRLAKMMANAQGLAKFKRTRRRR